MAAVGDGRFNDVNGFPTDHPTLGKLYLGTGGILEFFTSMDSASLSLTARTGVVYPTCCRLISIDY